MVRNVIYDRADVVAAALAVVREYGFSQLSARRVAAELGASTAPVYSNFASMEDLAVAVRLAIADLILAEAAMQRGDDPFLDMGVGVLEFARSQPGLYSALFMQAPHDCEAGNHVMQVLLQRMSRLKRLADLASTEREILLHKMAIFTHGLAVQLIAGNTDHLSWDVALALLGEVGQAMVADAFSRAPRSVAEAALLSPICQSPAENLPTDRKNTGVIAND